MDEGLTGWRELQSAAAGRLPLDFARATVRRAAAEQASRRAERRWTAATLIACVLVINGAHWAQTMRQHAKNVKLWQQAGEQLRQLEGDET